MASVSSAFTGAVSSAAYASFLAAIPDAVKADPQVVDDLSSLSGIQTAVGTSGSDYVILGAGDRLGQLTGLPSGFDVVKTASAINIEGTGFRGVVLDGTGNIGVTGSSSDDAIAGNSGSNVINAGAGRDVAAGGAGADRLDGGLGDDTLFGDAGNDILLGGAGNDELHGGDGDDKLTGGADNDTLYGDAGNDTLYGDAGNDLLHGGADQDSLDGGLGDDSLFGDAGDDFLSGIAGDDQLFGGDGADTLLGGYGSDIFTGGLGQDTFAMQAGQAGSLDVIADFKPSEDVIDLSATGVTSFEKLVMQADGNGTIITLPDNTKFKLIGYTPDTIDQNFFTF